MISETNHIRTIFVVDDEPVVTDALSTAVKAMGFSVRCFSSASEFIDFVKSYVVSGPVCLIADVQMPEISGIELLEQLVALGKTFPVILMTGGGGTLLRDEAEQLGAAAFLEKPFRSAHLQEVIAKVL